MTRTSGLPDVRNVIATAARALPALVAAGLVLALVGCALPDAGAGADTKASLAAGAEPPSCVALAEQCRKGGACGLCRARVCMERTCDARCSDGTYDLRLDQDCRYRGCVPSVDGRLTSGGDMPYWYSQVDSRRWYNCTGKGALPPLCFREFEARGIPAERVDCKTTEDAFACCGDRGVGRTCPLCGKAVPEMCINDFVRQGKPVDMVRCATNDGVRKCCGDPYISKVCPGKSPAECNCYNCGKAK